MEKNSEKPSPDSLQNIITNWKLSNKEVLKGDRTGRGLAKAFGLKTDSERFLVKLEKAAKSIDITASKLEQKKKFEKEPSSSFQNT